VNPCCALHHRIDDRPALTCLTRPGAPTCARCACKHGSLILAHTPVDVATILCLSRHTPLMASAQRVTSPCSRRAAAFKLSGPGETRRVRLEPSCGLCATSKGVAACRARLAANHARYVSDMCNLRVADAVLLFLGLAAGKEGVRRVGRTEAGGKGGGTRVKGKVWGRDG